MKSFIVLVSVAIICCGTASAYKIDSNSDASEEYVDYKEEGRSLHYDVEDEDKAAFGALMDMLLFDEVNDLDEGR
jgi:hypothetical protein